MPFSMIKLIKKLSLTKQYIGNYTQQLNGLAEESVNMGIVARQCFLVFHNSFVSKTNLK